MTLDLDQIFPIPDAPSARLMKLKALFLFRAGVVTEQQRDVVARHANEVLADNRLLRSRHSPHDSDSQAA